MRLNTRFVFDTLKSVNKNKFFIQKRFGQSLLYELIQMALPDICGNFIWNMQKNMEYGTADDVIRLDIKHNEVEVQNLRCLY